MPEKLISSINRVLFIHDAQIYSGLSRADHRVHLKSDVLMAEDALKRARAAGAEDNPATRGEYAAIWYQKSSGDPQ